MFLSIRSTFTQHLSEQMEEECFTSVTCRHGAFVAHGAFNQSPKYNLRGFYIVSDIRTGEKQLSVSAISSESVSLLGQIEIEAVCADLSISGGLRRAGEYQ